MMENKVGKIEIALPSDENYVMGLLATAASMAIHVRPSVTLSFNVLDGGITDETFVRFEDKIRQLHAKSVFHRIPVREDAFLDLPAWSGNKMTYARLLLPQSLPAVDHVVYCDTDFLWTTDIEPLWNLRDDDVPLQGALDMPATVASEEQWFAAKRLPFHADHYFGGGLMMMNLRLFREEHTIERAMQFIRQHPDVQFADQSAVNATLGDRTRMLDGRWHTLSLQLNNKLLTMGCGIHLASESPWRRQTKSDVLSDPKIMWHWFYGRLTGVTTWASLRQRFGALDILLRRGAFLWGATPLLKWLLLGPLWVMGFRSSAQRLRHCCRRKDWRVFRAKAEEALCREGLFRCDLSERRR